MSTPAATQEVLYQYDRPSALADTGTGRSLALSSCGGDAPGDFFQGQFVRPGLACSLLRALSSVVQTRFFVPASMRARLIRESDPVVSHAGGTLRFEGLSGCAGVYARVDFEADALRVVRAEDGCTNVDFNPPMLAALAQVREDESVSLAVGREELAMVRGAETRVERRVSLPGRWVRSLREVPLVLARGVRTFEMGRAEAVRLLRGTPRDGGSVRHGLIRGPGGVRWSAVESNPTLVMAGVDRLKGLAALAVSADSLRLFADPITGATEWILRFGPVRYHLALTPEPARGFSGEGQVLTAGEDPEGRGYDTDRGAWFSRVLPFGSVGREAAHPRMKGAQALLAAGGIRRMISPEGLEEIEVPGRDVFHRVRLDPSGDRCTCVWYHKHTGQRGPCRHVLAARLWIQDQGEGQTTP